MDRIDCEEFNKFAEIVGDDTVCDILERVCDCICNKESAHDIIISDIYQHDVVNHTGTGSFKHDGIEYGFIIESGNNRGTVVIEFGLVDDVGCYEPPEPTQYTFVPKDDNLKETNPQMYGVYMEWIKTSWFKEQVRNYMYDIHYAPGGKTESYYRDWADKKGLKIAIKR